MPVHKVLKKLSLYNLVHDIRECTLCTITITELSGLHKLLKLHHLRLVITAIMAASASKMRIWLETMPTSILINEDAQPVLQVHSLAKLPLDSCHQCKLQVLCVE